MNDTDTKRAAAGLLRAIVNDYCGSEPAWIRKWAKRNGKRVTTADVRRVVRAVNRKIMDVDMVAGGRWAQDLKVNDRTSPVAADARRRAAGRQ